MKYEYKSIVLEFKAGIFRQGLPDIATALNTEGLEGWRLKQLVVPSSSWGRVGVHRRRLGAPPIRQWMIALLGSPQAPIAECPLSGGPGHRIERQQMADCVNSRRRAE
ncbi:MAG: DUF4177 domain-containing protein [Steroidobacteraceae bacterium]